MVRIVRAGALSCAVASLAACATVGGVTTFDTKTFQADVITAAKTECNAIPAESAIAQIVAAEYAGEIVTAQFVADLVCKPILALKAKPLPKARRLAPAPITSVEVAIHGKIIVVPVEIAK